MGVTILFGVAIVFLSAALILTLAYGKVNGRVLGPLRLRQVTLNAVDLASSYALGLGLVSLLMSFVLAQWIHGSNERYLWIIRGPHPYDDLGGLVQVHIGAGLLIVGAMLLSAGLMARRWLVKAAAAEPPTGPTGPDK